MIDLDPSRITVPTPPKPVPAIVGVDVGQRNDWTAVAILTGSTLAALDRVRQESYDTVVDRVAALVERPGLTDATVVLDETGVGIAVGDLLAKALKARGKARQLVRVSITAGRTTAPVAGGYHVPKRELVTATALALESGRLRIPTALPLAGTLVEELANFKVKISAGGHDSYGAGADWREGNHDDLVLALALACWYRDRKPERRTARSF
jgi:hypothetical protein